MPELEVRCPHLRCETINFLIFRGTGEYLLYCENGHEIRRFFVLVPPAPPPPPVWSPHAAASVARPDR